MLNLSTDEVHLWFTFDEDVREPRLLPEYRRLLTDAERAQERRFYFAKHQRQYVITRALVRTVLSRYGAVAPERWRFVKNRFGRPSVDTVDDPAGELSFNLSHTDGLVVCAITRRLSLGVDVENVHRREVSLDIADRFFSPTEAATLRTVPATGQQAAFFRYWTLKESYIKAKGEGLSIPLDRFSFSPPQAAHISIAIDERLNDAPERWRFWLLRPSAEHLGAVCVARDAGQAPRLVLRRVVPLHTEESLDCPLLSRSE